MFQIEGSSKFLDLKGNIRLYYVVAFGIFASILGFVLYTDILTTFTMVVCTFVSYYLLSIPPENIKIEIDEEKLIIDEYNVNWGECVEWAVVDLHGTMEFVIRTTKLTHQFYYFYLDEKNSETKKFIAILSTYLTYNPQTPGLNPIHSLLRNWGLK